MFKSLVDLIAKQCDSEASRRMLVRLAFSSRDVLLSQIQIEGTPQNFAAHLVEILQKYGEVEPGVQALWRLLLTLKENVGSDVSQRIDTFETYANTPQISSEDPTVSRSRPIPFPTKSTELPPNYVTRPSEFEPIVNALVNEKQEAVAIVAALKGAGGYGKTTLAKAICQDLRIKNVFKDGILWITLGESLLDVSGLENELITRLKDAIVTLTGAVPIVSTFEALQDTFAQAIGNKSVLVVIDDVWAEAHVHPFIIRSEHNATLLTTRDADTMPRDTSSFWVDQMKWDDAHRLLTAGITSILPTDAPEIEALVQRLGRWALLLSLVNNWLSERVKDYHESMSDALIYANGLLDDEGLDAFDATSSQQRQKAAIVTLNASVKRLAPELQTLYQRLAIFPDDVFIPIATLTILWHLSPIQTKRTVERLWKASLLQDHNMQTIKLHDVVRAYLREFHREKLVMWNSRFLDSYPIQDWHEMAIDEPYLWQWLAYHLHESNQVSVLRNILLDPRYLQSKLKATNTNALIADYDAMKDDTVISLIRSALNLSAHILEQSKAALSHQLIGRLMGHQQSEDEIAYFIAALAEQAQGFLPAHLHSVHPTHISAGGILLRILLGHSDSVRSALELHDGRLLSWADDHNLRLWASDGSSLRVLEGHTNLVRRAFELHDGRLLSWAGEDSSSKSRDYTLRLWASDGSPLRTLKGHSNYINDVLELRDGRLFSWAYSRVLRLWASDGSPLRTLKGHTGYVRGVLELYDGRLLSWATDYTLRLWASDGSPLRTLKGHTNSVRGVIELRDGRLLSWAGEGSSLELRDYTLRLWASDGSPLRILEGHIGSVSDVLELRDGRLLSWARENSSSKSRDYTLRLWASDGSPLRILEGHIGSVSDVLELRDGRLLSWADDRTLRLWASDGSPLRALKGHTNSVRGLFELRDGRLLSWADDRTLRLLGCGWLSPPHPRRP